MKYIHLIVGSAMIVTSIMGAVDMTRVSGLPYFILASFSTICFAFGISNIKSYWKL